LDEWTAEVDKLKAKASGASADAQLELNKQIEALEGKIEEGKTKLTEIADASEDAWAAGESCASTGTLECHTHHPHRTHSTDFRLS